MAGNKNPKKHKPKNDWIAIREDYLVQNLDPQAEKPYTVAACAAHWGLNRKTIERHSEAEDWRGELRKRQAAISDARIEAHTDGFMEQQREIRKRHAMVAQGLISKAAKKLGSIKKPEKQLTVDQMVKMLTFGMAAEREAHGMPKYIQLEDVTHTDPERQFETPTMRMERRRIERLVDADLVKTYARLHDAGE